MSEKIENLYANYDVIEGIKPSGANSYAHKVNVIENITDSHPIYNHTSSIEEIYNSIINNETDASKYLVGKYNSNENAYKNLESKLNIDVMKPQDKRYRGTDAYVSYNTNEVKFKDKLVFFGAVFDVVENPNIGREKKVKFLEHVKEAQKTKGTVEDLEKNLKKFSHSFALCVRHEMTHMRDAGLVDLSSLDKNSSFMFHIMTEVNAKIVESSYLIEEGEQAWEGSMGKALPKAKEKIEDFYNQNNLKIGEKIPQEHKQNVHGILALSFMNDKINASSGSFFDIYRDNALDNISVKSDEHYGIKSLSMSQMSDMLGMSLSQDVLKEMNKMVFHPTSDYYKNIYAIKGVSEPLGKFTGIDFSVAKSQSPDTQAFEAVAALKSISDVKG